MSVSLDAPSSEELAQARFRRRKEEIQRLVAGHTPGDPLPRIAYTPEEDALWSKVVGTLRSVHRDTACSRYLDAAQRLDLGLDRVPALPDLSEELTEVTGFGLLPAGDLVPARQFYEAFADDRFHSTQYLRPVHTPYYTPEPDLIHELVGHAVMLADPGFAELYRCFGRTAGRVRSEADLDALSKVFWFTMEVGVFREGGGPRAYGAALLSSVGELEGLATTPLRDFSVQDMLDQPYDISDHQPVLFAADSFGQLDTEVRRFLDTLA
ncbi:phenylalanine 4-monooxygenase [Nocardiopsis sp. FIRDI 009]|uniref:phenylalanine 4-monooxygenase n=1 Tax=Nocardiopsis sp. FIRDI 009 TaxID=714197 RepID=UPI000E244C44|nr:phenylalanine 4-monooxygenase [Nocardiopsis sp. FIRDI 009]